MLDAQELHDTLISLIHQSMEESIEECHDESSSVSYLLAGLAGAVAETMATLADTFGTDNIEGREKFYRQFRKVVRQHLAAMANPVAEPQKLIPRLIVEARAENDPIIIRTVH